MYKQWPEDGSPVDFESLVKPFKKSFRFAYNMRRKNLHKDVPYDGFNLGRSDLACCLPAKEKLNQRNLKYSNEEQGRDALEELIGLVLQVGIEQGRRITKDSLEWKTMKMFSELNFPTKTKG